jgi:Protein of unknown function (DUF4232)
MRFRKSAAVAVGVVAAGVTMAAATPAVMASSQQVQTARSGRTCQTAMLKYALGAKRGTSSQRTQVVKLTNKGTSACTLRGFPGVNLIGTVKGKKNYSWPLVRESVRYSTVTLKPGGTAHFNLIYLPAAPGDGINITVTKIVITPPNDYRHAELSWHQSVLLQDGATHPGTYISPVMPGA